MRLYQAAEVVRVRLQDLYARRRDAAALARRAARMAHVVAQEGRRLALSPAAVHVLHLQRPGALSAAQTGGALLCTITAQIAVVFDASFAA